MQTLLIIPAFNEADHLEGVLKGAHEALPGVDILVVDDGSTDDTAAVGRQGGARVVRHPFNMGYGVALQTGYKFAFRKGYELILQMDGDGQHDALFFAPMIDLLQKAEVDLVLGSRFLGSSTYVMAWQRRLGIVLFNALVRFLTGQAISDSTSGFQAFRRPVLAFFISDYYPWDYPDADVLLMLHYARFRYREIPVTMYARPAGKSMHSGFLPPLYYVFKMLLSLVVTVLRGRKISTKILNQQGPQS